jgi:gliding motility-associated-like protein
LFKNSFLKTRLIKLYKEKRFMMIKKLNLFFTLILIVSSTINAQQLANQQKQTYEVKELLSEKMLNVDIKEFFVREIRKTDLVKAIDNHEFVHFYLDRYQTTYRELIKTELSKYKTIITLQQAEDLSKDIITEMANDFKRSKTNSTKVIKNNTARHIDLFNSINKGPGDPCTNADFETGDATGWDLSYGQVDPAPTAPFNYINVTPTTLATSTQHTIMTGAGTDAIGGFPVVYPGGTSSLMIGDGTGTNNSAADASQTFLVDVNSAAFSYSYAIVLMDPGHTPEEQPYFKINMYDENGDPIQCGDYSVVAGGSGADPDFLPFTFNSENGVYMPWRTTFAPLQGYIGQNVTIEFVVGDCSQGGHFGYAYIDASCASMEVFGPDTITCSGPIVISAPPGAASYLWSPTGETTESITVSTPGQYQVEVTPVTGATCSITLTKDIYEFIDTVTAAFTAVPTTICTGESVTFTDQSSLTGSGSIVGWQWDFDGNGITDNTTQNPTHVFNTAGSFNVNLNAVSQGCSDDTTLQITVIQTPTTNFTAPTVCLGVATDFTDVSTGGVNVWNWDFDNNGIVDNTTQNPDFTFTSVGSFPVSLSVSNGTCSHDTTINVDVTLSSIANFTAPTVCLGVATDFTDISLGGVDTWNWDFDNDGTVDNTSQNPTFTFASTGTFPVNLEVSVGSNCVHDTTINITVTESSIANFTAPTVCLGVATNFTDLSLGGVDIWNWDFDNNGTVDNSTQNPSFTFSSSGTFPVNLEVSVGGNCVHDTTINVTVTESSIANFTATTTCLGSATNFTDISTVGVDTWNWDFDNNGTVDNSTQNPSFTFTSTGTFPVNLEVSTGGLCSHDTTINVIVVSQPTASYNFNTACLGETTFFNDASNGNGSSLNQWEWDFNNDGIVDNTSQNPSQIFSNSGSFTVSLTVASSSGCEDIFTSTVNVFANPIADFATEANPCENNSTQFNDLSLIGSSIINSWNWDFNSDGTIDNINQSPSITSDPNNSLVTLYVSDVNGCNDSIVKSVVVEFLNATQSIVPNIFTPNGDNWNDELVFKGVDDTKEFSIKIFNRWGRMMFESTDALKSWDGKDATDGTYFYELKYTDICSDVEKLVTGTVTLLRGPKK